jgi:orotate phosphoribosyltransferase
MTSPEYLDPQYADGLMRKAVVTGDFILASGVRSNAKFDFDLIDTDSELFSRIVSGLSECIADNFTDFDSVLTVANGATRLGDPLSELLEVPHIESSYTIDGTGKKIFTVSSPVIAKKPIIVDDVFTRGTNATKVANAAVEIGIEATGVAVVLDRSGASSSRILGNRAVHSLVRQFIG